jgi:6-pyruvoyltetrahydropterin/6-carboxytetrahydropterin synthase
MLELSRTIRFCLNADGTLATDAPQANTFAAWPPMRGLGRYYELEVVCRGQADAATGYFLNIKTIDQAARKQALPAASESARSGGSVAELMRRMLVGIDRELGGCVARIELALSPTYRVAIEGADMDSVLISQQYEFAAAHRLHAPALSDEENRRVFGKCNNPAGHGHNYRVEVTVRCPIDPRGAGLEIEKLDELVDRAAISRLDHKHLSVDVPEFQNVNTSVENIARVVHGMLKDAVKSLGVTLDQVRVWETAKTVCTYRG